jgi:salicylate hydroxylase
MRIAIVGGGLGGLAAALFLRKAGLEATVYEQVPELREAGAGIVVSPNMVRPLRRSGSAKSCRHSRFAWRPAWEFRRWKDGRVLFAQPMGDECERLYGTHCYVAHRADLLALLQQALRRTALRLDHRCVGVDQNEHEAELTFASAGGRTTKVTADVIIGADGIHSWSAGRWSRKSMRGSRACVRFAASCRRRRRRRSRFARCRRFGWAPGATSCTTRSPPAASLT